MCVTNVINQVTGFIIVPMFPREYMYELATTELNKEAQLSSRCK